jgi:hypothetical protein
MLTHTRSELIPHAQNREKISTEGEHPEFLCSEHIYVLCPTDNVGFEKGQLLHKRHENCQHMYSEWLIEPVPVAPIELVVAPEVQSKRPAGSRAGTRKATESKKGTRKVKIVEVPAPENTITCDLGESLKPDKTCDCHLEICRLNEQVQTLMAELNTLQTWRDMVLATAPPTGVAESVQKAEPAQKAESAPRPSPAKIKKATVKPSKKEKELGMWCTRCESCKDVAEYATDLRPCTACKKLCHFNDDFHSCYHWDCEVCKKAVCLQCNRAAGGSKLHPLCSQECAKKYKLTRT